MAGQASSMLDQGLMLDGGVDNQQAMTRNPLSQLETGTSSQLAIAELKHGTSNACHEPAGPPPPLIVVKEPQDSESPGRDSGNAFVDEHDSAVCSRPWHRPRSAGESVILADFLCMSVCFSINQATLTTVIAYTTTRLGRKLGADTLAVLKLSYVTMALIFAAPLVALLGHKRSLIVGLLLCTTTNVSMLLAPHATAGPWGWDAPTATVAH